MFVFGKRLSLFAIAMSIIIGSALTTGCHKYDDSQIKRDIKELQEKLASTDSFVRFGSYDKQTVKNGDRIELVLASAVTKDNYAGIQADVINNSGTTTAIATKSGTGNSWNIEEHNPEFGSDGKVTKNPAVVILEAGEYQTDAFLKVYLRDNEGQSHVTTKTIISGECPLTAMSKGYVFKRSDLELSPDTPSEEVIAIDNTSHNLWI